MGTGAGEGFGLAEEGLEKLGSALKKNAGRMGDSTFVEKSHEPIGIRPMLYRLPSAPKYICISRSLSALESLL